MTLRIAYKKTLLIFLFWLIGISGAWADGDDEIIETPREIEERLMLLEETLENYSVSFKKNIALGSPFIIDISQLQEIA